MTRSKTPLTEKEVTLILTHDNKQIVLDGVFGPDIRGIDGPITYLITSQGSTPEVMRLPTFMGGMYIV